MEINTKNYYLLLTLLLQYSNFVTMSDFAGYISQPFMRVSGKHRLSQTMGTSQNLA